MSHLATVVVAMSGGVDSSVAAALLVEQGYTVIGMMLRLWSEPGMEAENRCCTPDDMALAKHVAGKLRIPFYVKDVREPFRQEVVQAFIDGYRAGLTPNPCIRCNRHIRWGYLLNQALALGAEYMATGHYARIQREPDGSASLLRAVDEKKDQSYVLSVLGQEQLAHTLLPLGEYTKEQVRELAKGYGLGVSRKPDSQDLCFLAGQDYRQFLARHTPEVVQPGAIVDRQGQVLGEHQGLAFYTIGQRKGLGIAAPTPFYVLEKDLENNRLVVGTEEALGRCQVIVSGFNWTGGNPPASPVRVQAKIRYRAAFAEAELTVLEDGRVRLAFDQKLRDITPGQRAVAYDGDRVLGGGMIETVLEDE